MEEQLKKVENFSDQQSLRFRKGLGADLAFLVLILILYFVNIYSYFKLEGNPPQDRLLIFIALYFFTGWCVFNIFKNCLGWISLSKLNDELPYIRKIKSNVLKIRTDLFFNGFYYDVIDKNLSEYVLPLQFHIKRKKANLISLNIRYAFWDFLIISTGIAMFASQVIYYKQANFSHWEMIFGLVIMIVLALIVIAYLIPRQYIINRQIRLNNRKKISEEKYYDSYKYFYVEKVLAKFWNRD